MILSSGQTVQTHAQSIRLVNVHVMTFAVTICNLAVNNVYRLTITSLRAWYVCDMQCMAMYTKLAA